MSKKLGNTRMTITESLGGSWDVEVFLPLDEVG
jgi:hypothetical protein